MFTLFILFFFILVVVFLLDIKIRLRCIKRLHYIRTEEKKYIYICILPHLNMEWMSYDKTITINSKTTCITYNICVIILHHHHSYISMGTSYIYHRGPCWNIHIYVMYTSFQQIFEYIYFCLRCHRRGWKKKLVIFFEEDADIENIFDFLGFSIYVDKGITHFDDLHFYFYSFSPIYMLFNEWLNSLTIVYICVNCLFILYRDLFVFNLWNKWK